jgi:hypothetical protein
MIALQDLVDRLRLCSSYAELLVHLHGLEVGLDFDNENELFNSVIIAQDPWRLILDDVKFLASSNGSSTTSLLLDIWMAPQVCNYFLLAKDREAKNALIDIHKQCRDRDPDKRPNAAQLFRGYKDLLQRFQSLKPIKY